VQRKVQREGQIKIDEKITRKSEREGRAARNMYTEGWMDGRSDEQAVSTGVNSLTR
jgi:hypothetical protein